MVFERLRRGYQAQRKPAAAPEAQEEPSINEAALLREELRQLRNHTASLQEQTDRLKEEALAASAVAPATPVVHQQQEQHLHHIDAQTNTQAEVLRLREQLRLAEARLHGGDAHHAELPKSMYLQGASPENVMHQRRLVPEEDFNIEVEGAIAAPRVNARRDGLVSSQNAATIRGSMLGTVQEGSPHHVTTTPIAARREVEVNESVLQRPFVEGQRLYHHRSDNGSMPTALRARPNSGAPPLQDARAEPGEEVLVLHTQMEADAGESVAWVRVRCGKGEGWLKQMHLREAGSSRMLHERGDNPLLPTALRERPTNTARPLDNVKAEAREPVVVHVEKEVLEAGRRTTWVKVSCGLGQGWIKREHLRELSTMTKDYERPCATDVSTANPESGPLPMPTSLSTPLQSERSFGKQSATSEYPAHGIRIRLGTLEFASGSVISNTSIFERVGIVAMVQMGDSLRMGGPPAVWIQDAPKTDLQAPKYGRVVSEDGRYATRMLCAFNSAALDMPWPPEPSAGGTDHNSQDFRREPKKLQQLPDKVAVDLWLERSTVVDRFDRALGTLGLHNPADFDRRWLGRAVAELPPEGVDDAPFAWCVETGPKVEDCPEPRTLQIGVEWLMEKPEAD